MARIHTFDPNQHEKHREVEPLPSGWYPMKIAKDEVVPTKGDPEQAFLEVEYEIDETRAPSLKGHKAWDRLNLYNKNEQAVKIANGMLKSICLAVGHVGPIQSDTAVLHGKPMAVKLRYVGEDGKFRAKNEVLDVDTIAARFPNGFVPNAANSGGTSPSGKLPPPNAAPAAGAAPAVNTAPSTPPWGGAPQAGAAAPTTPPQG